jgi:hypothetical protein
VTGQWPTRQLVPIAANNRCSTRFHFDVPGANCLVVIASRDGGWVPAVSLVWVVSCDVPSTVVQPKPVCFGAVLRGLLAGLEQVGCRGQFGDHIEQVVQGWFVRIGAPRGDGFGVVVGEGDERHAGAAQTAC